VVAVETCVGKPKTGPPVRRAPSVMSGQTIMLLPRSALRVWMDFSPGVSLPSIRKASAAAARPPAAG
jgi:hypothetical protein